MLAILLYALVARTLRWRVTKIHQVLAKLSFKTDPKQKIAALVVLLLAGFIFVHDTVEIWSKEISPSLTSKGLIREFTPGLIKKFLSASGAIQEKPTLGIQLKRIEGHMIDLLGEKTEWTQSELETKYQYIITIENRSPEDIGDLSLAFQFPFFVERHNIERSEGISGLAIHPNFTRWSATPGLNVKLIGKPRPMNFSVMSHKISPGGSFDLVFVFDRKARSVKQTIPLGSQTLKNGKCEFISGRYKYKAESFEIYCPIDVQKNGTFQLGPSERKIPEDLITILSLG